MAAGTVSGSSRRFPAAARSKARRLAMQAVYQWQMTAHDATDILAQFLTDADNRGADTEYFEVLVRGVVQGHATLDALLAPVLARPLDEVDPVERAMLRVAAFELQQCLDVPYRVVLNEAVALTKKYGAEQGHTFVNAALDRLARDLRAVEMRG
ncbi:MAG: transcription antitermination factor NusB [Thiohalobacteraceae bacterium]|nr:transcription antitermination factor NusB [Gammaproteobacteria bacterium]